MSTLPKATLWQTLNNQIEERGLQGARDLAAELFPHQEKYDATKFNELLMALKAFVQCVDDQRVPSLLRRIGAACTGLGTSKKFSRERLDAKRLEINDAVAPLRQQMVTISQGNWALDSDQEFVDACNAAEPKAPPPKAVASAEQNQRALSHLDSKPRGKQSSPAESAERLEAKKLSDKKIGQLLTKVIGPILEIDLSPKEREELVSRLAGVLGVRTKSSTEFTSGASRQKDRTRPTSPKPKAQEKSKYPPEVLELNRQLEGLKKDLASEKKKTGKDLPPEHPKVTAKRELMDKIAKLKTSFRTSKGASDSGGDTASDHGSEAGSSRSGPIAK